MKRCKRLAILDLFFVPKSETIRQSCHNIFTSCTACPPIDLCNQRRHSKGRRKQKARDIKANGLAFLDKCLESAVENEKLPRRAARRFRAFVSHGSLPYPVDANKALDMIYESSRKLHATDVNSSNYNDDTKRLSRKCFEEVVCGISQLRQLIKAMEAIGIITAIASSKKDHLNVENQNLSYPAYISIDLGLRQKKKHYDGSLFYQAILLQDDFFNYGEPIDNAIISGGKGVRIAEGGR